MLFGKILKTGIKKIENVIDLSRLPAHIAIIPDGNGRWATKRGLPRSAGHREGSRNLKGVVKFAGEIGIKYMTIYVFSTENWVRPKPEVDALMSMLLEFLRNAENEIGGDNVRIRVIGNISILPEEFRSKIARVEKLTEKNGGLTLVIAFNYGGRDEIVHAFRKIADEIKKGSLNPENIDEKLISANMYAPDIPDPDLIIRTSGEVRASNFLLWEAAYSEYLFPEELWPDFKREHLTEAIKEFQRRKRRFGGV